MIEHMNAEHADANLLYAQVYGQMGQATGARILVLDHDGMELEVTLPEGRIHLRLPFDHRLHDAKDAERTLVAMARYAQEIRRHTTPSSACEDAHGSGETPSG
jgi:putative heme iron utilization protein